MHTVRRCLWHGCWISLDGDFQHNQTEAWRARDTEAKTWHLPGLRIDSVSKRGRVRLNQGDPQGQHILHPWRGTCDARNQETRSSIVGGERGREWMEVRHAARCSGGCGLVRKGFRSIGVFVRVGAATTFSAWHLPQFPIPCVSCPPYLPLSHCYTHPQL